MNAPRRDAQPSRLGPWGTSRQTERRFGYPSPRRDTPRDTLDLLDTALDEIEGLRNRLEAVEAAFYRLGDDHDLDAAIAAGRVAELEGLLP